MTRFKNLQGLHSKWGERVNSYFSVGLSNMETVLIGDFCLLKYYSVKILRISLPILTNIMAIHGNETLLNSVCPNSMQFQTNTIDHTAYLHDVRKDVLSGFYCLFGDKDPRFRKCVPLTHMHSFIYPVALSATRWPHRGIAVSTHNTLKQAHLIVTTLQYCSYIVKEMPV